jgi:hypothetical protein
MSQCRHQLIAGGHSSTLTIWSTYGSNMEKEGNTLCLAASRLLAIRKRFILTAVILIVSGHRVSVPGEADIGLSRHWSTYYTGWTLVYINLSST